MSKSPRIILYAGKGGVGKTSVSTATALQCAKRGHRTLVISLDMAHSLSDSFDLKADLHDVNRGEPVRVMENLWIQEIDIQEEIERHWGDVYAHVTKFLKSAGLDEVVADELAVIPGMENVVLLLYINQHVKARQFDVLILDCAPTGESLSFLAMPSTLDWYVNKAFRMGKGLSVIRPLASKVMGNLPVPDRKYFRNLKDIYDRLKDVDKILLDSERTSVRLVTVPEKMVVRETQRAYMYFSMFGMVVDCVVINRLFPEDEESAFIKKLVRMQQKYKEEIKEYFEPVPVKTLAVADSEIKGIEQVDKLGQQLFNGEDPVKFFHTAAPYKFVSSNGDLRLELKLPGVQKASIDLLKKDEDLIVRVGRIKRHILLPGKFARREPSGARFRGDVLCVYF